MVAIPTTMSASIAANAVSAPRKPNAARSCWLRAAVNAPCTTTIRGLPSEVVLEPGEDPIGRRGAVNLDSVESVSIAVLVERLGSLSGERMGQICDVLAIAADCS